MNRFVLGDSNPHLDSKVLVIDLDTDNERVFDIDQLFRDASIDGIY